MQTLIAEQMKEIEKKLNNIKALEKAMEDKEVNFCIIIRIWNNYLVLRLRGVIIL